MSGESPVGNNTIPRLLERTAGSDRSSPAIVAPGRSPLSHQDLASLVGSTGAILTERGIEGNDRVGLVVGNGPEAATAFLSLACAAACAPLNPSYRREEFEFYLDDLEVRAVVVSRDLDSPVRGAARARGIPVFELDAVLDLPAGTFTLDDVLPEPSALRVRSPDDQALLLHTSGTTSRPKLVPLTHRNLTASARSVAGTLALEPGDRCLNLMPLFHIHGLVAAVLASLHAGASVACTPGFHAIHAFEWLDELEPTWFTAVPTMHQALLARCADHPETMSRHHLRFIRSSSAALPVPVLEGIERAFRVPVIEAYGMTEAAHQMASNPLPPGQRRPGTVGPAAGPEIAILSLEGEPLPAGAVGEVAIRGESVFAGYERNPEANDAAFAAGWFRTGDEGHLGADGYLTLSGRIKELINRGGEKIAPIEVDERLLSHPAVAEAVTFSVPEPRLGEEVAAAVVLAEGRKTSARELQDFAAQALAPFKVPRHIYIVDEIPKGPTGKIQRIGLADRLGIETEIDREDTADFEPPRSDFELLIAGVWANVLGVEPVGRDDDFFALGGDSILGAEAVARLRELTGRPEIPLVSIVRAPTVAGMVGELDRDIASLNRWGAVPLSLEPGGKRFFFVHGGDGEAIGYVALARAIGTGCAFYALRARGIDDGQPLHSSLEEMAVAYVAEVREVQPQGPYALGGLCVGATIAVEMARLLEAAGERLSLVLVDPRPRRPNDLRYQAWRLARSARERRLGDAIGRRIRRRSSPDPIPTTVTDTTAWEIGLMRRAHRPRTCGVPTVTILSDRHDQYGIPAWHVRRIVPRTSFVRIHTPHDTILRPPHVGVLAEAMREALEIGEASR